MRVSNPAAKMSSGFLGVDECRPPFTLEEKKAWGIAGWTNVNECKLRDPDRIGADHTRGYRGSKRGQVVTIERLSLSIPSHTGREVKWQGHTPVWLLVEYSSHPNIWLRNGATHKAPAEREGLPDRMSMGAGFFEKARADLLWWY